MTAIHLDHLSFSYSSAVDVLDDVSAHIGTGWTGVVGPNGAGKSTLFALISGELTPDAGRLVVDPAGAAITRCVQEVDAPTPQIERCAQSTDGRARKWLGRMELDAGGFWRWDTLSPGERKRWQLAAALASEPHVLLLDEPTNHLDAAGRALIESAMRRFEGTGLIISHDRGFLDRLTTRTLRLSSGAVRLWSGSYSVARSGWESEAAAEAERYAKLRRREKTMRKRLATERRVADERDARFRRSMRTADPKDHDATSTAAKGRHEAGSTAGQRRRTVLRGEIERVGRDAADAAPERVLGSSLYFDYEPSPKRRLLTYTGPLVAGESTLLDHVDVAVQRDDRIRLVGPNGAGKSTLLECLSEGSAIAPDRLRYLPQEMTRAEGVDLLGDLAALRPDRRGRVLNVVAALGVDPDQLLASDRPSPGEARKLAIALGLGTGAWCLLLDEPTNHLDLPAVERLEQAIERYPGAIVVVTHEESFAAGATRTVWRIEDGALRVEASSFDG